MKDNLTNRVMRGGVWITGLKATEKILNWIRLIIIARILAPDDFGLMGIALLSLGIVETFSETGFTAALIQKKKNPKSYLKAAWTVSAVRGIILFGIMWLIAPLSAVFFKKAGAELLVKLIGVSCLTRGFTNIKVLYYSRDLNFHKKFLYILSGSVVDFIVTVALALILRSPIALVIGLVAGSLTRLIVSYLIDHWKPGFDFNTQKIKSMFGFGKWILASNVLAFLLAQGDALFVGKFLGIAMLGFYQMAYRFTSTMSIQLAFVITEVTFPAYSRLQDDIPKLKHAYLRVLKITSLISFPVAAVMFIFAHDFTFYLLGEKWLPMVPVLQLLAIGGAIRLNGEINGVLFRGMGIPKYQTVLSLLKLIGIAILIYPLSKSMGITGTALAATLPFIVIGLFEVFIVRTKLHSRALHYFTQIWPAGIATVSMTIILLAIKGILGIDLTLHQFLSMGVFSVLYYCSFIYIYSRFNKKYLPELDAVIDYVKDKMYPKPTARVSVVIPSYNGASFIEKALDSVLAQSYPPYEIIVIDDGSTDNTKAVLKKYQNKIRYYYWKNHGLSAARNRGIKLAKGELVALLDSDDYWAPDKLRLQVLMFDKLKNTNVGMIDTFTDIISASGVLDRRLSRVQQGDSFERLLCRNTINQPSSVLIKKEVFDTVGLFNEKLKAVEDWEMWVRIAESYDIYTVPRPLTYYLKHSGNLSNNFQMMHKNSDKAVRHILRRYEKYLTPGDGHKIIACQTAYFMPLYFKSFMFIRYRELFRKAFLLYPLFIIKFNITLLIYYILSYSSKNTIRLIYRILRRPL